jgi:CubicO group peptidase (beta-lactamase class C family)
MRLLFVSVAVYCCSNAYAQKYFRKIDSMTQLFASRNDFSGNILVQMKGKTIFKKSYGFANVSWRVKNSETTKFQIGSISKQFTAAAILLLEQKDKLSVKDKIQEYFPEYTNGKDITIEQLLTHTGAVKNVYTVAGYGSFKRSDISFQDLLSKIMAEPLTGKPGTAYNYSNGAFNLLAAIVEKVSGISYPNFLEKNFFKPLNMSASGHYENYRIFSNMANGYEASGNSGVVNGAYLNDNIHYGSGSLYSTVPDMVKWVTGLRSFSVLNEKQMKKMLTNYINGYGFGISVYKQFGKNVYGHDGRVPGFNCSYLYYPDDEVMIIIFSNIQTQVTDLLQTNIAALLFNKPLEETPASLSGNVAKQEDINQYTGVYSFGPNFNVKVYVEHGALYAASDESEGSELIYTSDNSFFNRNLYASIKFEKDSQGKFSKMLWQTLGTTDAFPGIKQIKLNE